MLSKRYLQEKPAERRWISSLDRWLKKVHGYSVLATGPPTPPPSRAAGRIRPVTSDNGQKRFSSSTARPVIVVERIADRRQLGHECPRPVININDHFIEVYYCTKTNLKNAAHFERYSRTSSNMLCYCCDDCLACKRDRNANLPTATNLPPSSRHRPLHQVDTKSRLPATAQLPPADKRKYSTKLKSHHSFYT